MTTTNGVNNPMNIGAALYWRLLRSLDIILITFPAYYFLALESENDDSFLNKIIIKEDFIRLINIATWLNPLCLPTCPINQTIPVNNAIL